MDNNREWNFSGEQTRDLDVSDLLAESEQLHDAISNIDKMGEISRMEMESLRSGQVRHLSAMMERLCIYASMLGVSPDEVEEMVVRYKK